MDEREFDDLARELHETRAEPRPEFTRELDRQAAGWLGERPSRRLPSLRIAIPVAAAAALSAALVIAVVGSGDDESTPQLEVAVVAEQGEAGALGAPLAKDDSAARSVPEGGFARPVRRRVDEGEPVTVRYFFTAPTKGSVELAGREAGLEVPAGAGRLEISTDGVAAGSYRLEIAVPATPLYRERVEIDG